MIDPIEAAKLRAQEFANRRRLKLGDVVGYGADGVVIATSVHTVVKSLKYKELYAKELAVYRRLEKLGFDSVCGFNVPKLISNHDELLIIEIEFVTPPFIVDFASAGVDADPLAKFDADQQRETIEEWTALFGSHWPKVRSLYRVLNIH
jgi:hypothetical protein